MAATLSDYECSRPIVSPSKEIKIVSAVRRSSMSSCGSSGYFSSSPTLSSSPPVLCNPKSGEWLKSGPISLTVTVRDCGQPGFSGKQILRWRETIVGSL